VMENYVVMMAVSVQVGSNVGYQATHDHK
jgi:hypothetical protein